ncbi:MAG: 4Fe-4S dicluster domain-containing protein [Acidimicrobiales bacterium]
MHGNESLALFPASMAVTLDPLRCQGCGACIVTCHTRAIRAVGRTLLLDAGKCNGCLECVEVCPANAFSITDASESRRTASLDGGTSQASRFSW